MVDGRWKWWEYRPERAGTPRLDHSLGDEIDCGIERYGSGPSVWLLIVLREPSLG